MVVAVGQIHFTANTNKVAFLGLDDRRHLAYGAQGQDPHLRLVDDGRTENTAEGTYVGNRIRALFYLIGL